MIAITDFLSFALALIGLWVLFFWFYRDYRIDRFRQHIFALRDELFDYAAAGHIAFDHPSYVYVRRNLNGMLRFGHHLTLSWLLARAVTQALWPTPEIDEAFRRERDHRLDSLGGETRTVFKSIWERSNIRAAEHIVLSSPVFWILVLPVVAVLFVVLCWRAGAYALLRFFPGIELVDTEAANLGALA